MTDRYKIRIINDQHIKEFETGLNSIEDVMAETTRYINQKMVGTDRRRKR